MNLPCSEVLEQYRIKNNFLFDASEDSGSEMILPPNVDNQLK